MTPDTSKATGRPWSVYLGSTLGVGDDVSRARIVTADYPVWADARGDIEATNRAALIVERVNGWEALVAERDALREALERIDSIAATSESNGTTPGATAEVFRLAVEDYRRGMRDAICGEAACSDASVAYLDGYRQGLRARAALGKGGAS